MRHAGMKSRPPGPVSQRLRHLREEQSIARDTLAAQTGVATATIGRFENEYEPAPNHPLLARLASGLGVEIDELTEGTTATPLSEGELRIIEGAGTRHRRRVKKRAAALVRTNGHKVDALVAAKADAPHKKRRNALKRLDHKSRQLARGFAELVNMARMKGERYVTFGVPIPVDAFAAVLEDYFQLKGIKQRVLIEADFVDVFG